ncbi:MAG: PHP domain-containing protein [Lachnospiraceae bacterium]|nr:PHP domain-containing protein [Lachnospiraceae bacterium]
MKLDMHCHTKEGSPDGKVPLLENIELLKRKGFQGMLISDHNSYKAYRYYKNLPDKPKDFTVLCGIEYDTLDAGHILVIMPSGICPKIMELRGLPVFLLIEIVHLYGGILGPAHPCGEKFLSIFNTRLGKLSVDKLMKHFDFIEAYNACEDELSNNLASALARKYHLPEFGGSDSHKPDCVGLGYTLLQQPVQTENDFIRYITAGLPVTSGGTHYPYTTKQKLGKANGILVYSFWFYNKFLAFFRTKARNLELKRQKDE